LNETVASDVLATPPLVAVLSDACHHLHVITWAVEVLVASARFHCGEFLDDVRPAVLRALSDEDPFGSSHKPNVIGASEHVDTKR